MEGRGEAMPHLGWRCPDHLHHQTPWGCQLLTTGLRRPHSKDVVGLLKETILTLPNLRSD